ncbi:hypothetical protein PLESTM_001622500 [Pleodorina starrii]|nr:hypothetical protein PLESTM_001622500 [Pleodorina starrii]
MKVCTSATAVDLANYCKELAEKHQLTDRVVAVVTDTPNVNKAFWRMIEEHYRKEHKKPLIAFGCGAHRINLFCGDIGKLSTIKALLSNVKQIVNCFDRNQVPGKLLTEERERKNVTSGLEGEGNTRFATHSRVATSLLICKDSVRAAVVHPEWPGTETCKTTYEEFMRPVTKTLHELKGDTSTVADMFKGQDDISVGIKEFCAEYKKDPHPIAKELILRSPALWDGWKEYTSHAVLTFGGMLHPYPEYREVHIPQTDRSVMSPALRRA